VQGTSGAVADVAMIRPLPSACVVFATTIDTVCDRPWTRAVRLARKEQHEGETRLETCDRVQCPSRKITQMTAASPVRGKPSIRA
jgi:hypothetical protein